MNKKRLAILMRARLGLPANHVPQHQKLLQPTQSPPQDAPSFAIRNNKVNSSGSDNTKRILIQDVKECMNTSIQIPVDKGTTIDENLEDFSKGYLSLSQEERWELLLSLARDYDVNRARVCDLMRHYLSLELPRAADVGYDEHSGDGEGVLAAFYRMERNLRDALKPMYAGFLERLNAHPGGLKLLTILRADVISYLEKENVPSLRALDSYLKEKLITWLSPAALELHQITWDDSASLLEKIIVYEAVHPIKNLLDLKRRLSEGRRCFGYLHPAIPGEPLIFIEVSLLKDIATSIQEVLWESPPIPEFEATCALFYSISSTQPGLSGINLGKFLIKRVVDLLKRDMPHIKTFATLSPIPGFMNWLLSKLVSQIKLANSTTQGPTNLSEKGSKTFQDDVLLPEEEEMICSGYVKWLCSEEASQISDNMSEINELNNKLLVEEKVMSFREKVSGRNALKILYDLLMSKDWTKSNSLTESLKSPLLRLCARYLVKEKKRGKALDVVANFHLQNGAVIERINWMADPSEKGIEQSGSIMVNYVYRLDNIDENAQSYLGTGHIHASNKVSQYLEE